MNSRFEPLRDMETFTQIMFDNIISFQEKEHPAWNMQAPFEQRIYDLPLHYLIFSSPDRDPKQFGPTIAHFYPLKEEIEKIAYYACAIGIKEMADLYCGNGFIGSLIAREGISLVGLSKYTQKPNQIERFHDASSYRFSDISLSQATCDGVLVSWPPSGINPTPQILEIKPKIIVYLYTDHKHPQTGERQCGCDGMTDLPEEYHLLEQWNITRPENLLHDIWPDMTPSPEEIRTGKIFVHKNYADVAKRPNSTSLLPYSWEKEYQMVMLALEAKQELRMRGVSV